MRKVYFFRMESEEDGSGEEKPIDIRPVLKGVGALEFKDGERYIDNGDGNSTCAWVDSMGAEPRMRLAKIRKSDLPQYERKGELGDLDLPDDAGLAEAMHMVFFPDNVVGAEFNFHGPRATWLPWYLREAVPALASSISGMGYLLRTDVFEQLSRLGSVRTLTLTAKPTYAATLAREDRSLGAILSAAAAIPGAGQVSLSISVERYSRKGHLSGLLPALKRIVRGKSIPIELVSKFEVSGFSPETGRVEAVDLLRDYLVAEAKMLKVDPKTRALTKESVYSGIRDAHDRLKPDIKAALRVS